MTSGAGDGPWRDRLWRQNPRVTRLFVNQWLAQRFLESSESHLGFCFFCARPTFGVTDSPRVDLYTSHNHRASDPRACQVDFPFPRMYARAGLERRKRIKPKTRRPWTKTNTQIGSQSLGSGPRKAHLPYLSTVATSQHPEIAASASPPSRITQQLRATQIHATANWRTRESTFTAMLTPEAKDASSFPSF